jgi:hypothetical protein
MAIRGLAIINGQVQEMCQWDVDRKLRLGGGRCVLRMLRSSWVRAKLP